MRAAHDLPVRTLANVFVNHEALIFRRGWIYTESFVQSSANQRRYRRPSRYAWFLLKNYWLRRGAVNLHSGLWVIDNYSPDNYHHWIIDVLPRLLHAEEIFPDEHVLALPAYYSRQPYIHFTLRAFPHIHTVYW